ncbi:MAG: TonB family protein [Acidobacteria bacterium]|nr:TonB family protein [Acidobacteriota bacterium]
MIEMESMQAAAVAVTNNLWRASIQSLLLAALCGAGLWAFRAKAPALRHAVWSLAAAIMLLSLGSGVRVPATGIDLPVSQTIYMVVTAGGGAPQALPVAPSEAWRLWLGGVWLAGLAWFLLRWALGALWLRRLLTSATPLEAPLAAGARWLESSAVRTPLVVGRLRPAVLLPAGWREWSESKRAAVVSHETAHIRRGDPAVMALAALNKAVFWFHPLAWWLERQIVSEAELACDDEASLALGDRREYAQALLEVAAGMGAHSRRFLSAAVAMAGAAPVARRVDRMLAGGPQRGGVLPRVQWAALSAVVFCGFALTFYVRPTLAQSGGTAVEGVISDPSGARVPGAQVLLLDENSEAVAKTASGSDGSYRLAPSGAGPYTLLVLGDGFAPYRKSRITVVAGATATEAVTLDVAGVEEIITVGPRVAQSGPGGRPTRIRVGGAVQRSRLLKQVQPAYPPEARAERVHGTVMLDAVIDEQGVPTELLAEPNGVDARLVKSAIEAVRQWRYKPTLLNGNPIEVQTKVQINFTLSQ